MLKKQHTYPFHSSRIDIARRSYVAVNYFLQFVKFLSLNYLKLSKTVSLPINHTKEKREKIIKINPVTISDPNNFYCAARVNSHLIDFTHFHGDTFS